MIYLDTHVAVWLAAGEASRLSRRAQKLVNAEDLVISPIVLLEIEFLKEIGRLRASSRELFEVLSREIGLSLSQADFAQVIRAAIEQRWTRDPFDRVIVGEAALFGERLLTKDEKILRAYPQAVWD